MDKRFPKEIPINTYRLQMGPSMTFKNLLERLPYLKSMGIDTVYTSPFFECVPGKGNPYAIISNSRINPEVGTLEEFWEVADRIHKAGFKWVIDFVPNHMAADKSNRWFADVLKKGEESKFAPYFDVFWNTHLKGLKYHILSPVLGEGEEEREEGAALLTPWTEARHRCNYRRFFDITDLIGMNVEIPEVFGQMHKLLFEMAASGAITGIRIDHPDGLYDPKSYFEDLALHTNGMYVVAEKILQEGEQLNSEWKVAGTVGYDVLNQVTRLYVDSSSEAQFDRLYWGFLGEERDPEEMLYIHKKEILKGYISGEISILANALYQIVTHLMMDFKGSFQSLKDVLVEFLAGMVLYRTYVEPSKAEFSVQDRAAIDHAFDEIQRYNPKMLGESFGVIKALFSMEYPNPFRRVYLKLQQWMPCVFAKAFEDTFLYTYNRLIALNEVGGDPLYFGMSLGQFHLDQQNRLENFPYSMVTLNTHDTKRSHDLRMRLCALSEFPDEWQGYINTFHRILHPQIDANTEYFIYQTMVAMWPLDREGVKQRIAEYLRKAVREAKEHTNWVEPDLAYESRVMSFCERAIDNPDFIETLEPFAERIAALGEKNTLSSIALSLCLPGVFDLYQGTEVFDDSLVDPDNRREIDWGLLEKDQSPKHTLLRKGLNLRLEMDELFLHGSYQPIETGDKRLMGVRRVLGSKEVICLAGRTFSKWDSDGITLKLSISGDYFNLENNSHFNLKNKLNNPYLILYKK